jgi:hypothetical protein
MPGLGIYFVVVAAVVQAAIGQNWPEPPNNGDNFTIINGQIFTPGLAIIDAPQPYTPEGGGTDEFERFRRLFCWSLD